MSEAVATPGAAEAAQEDTASDNALRFEFTGSGSEYFRIWVVNLLFTVLTLGVYSAWAKVRRLQYFYRNTRVGGDIFDYHGNPKAILKGRLLAVGLLIAYKLAHEHPWALLAVIGLIVALTPWLLARAFRFKLANSSYRGLRFRFAGTVGQAYRMLILFPVIFVLTGFLLWSLWASYGRTAGFGLVLFSMLLVLVVMGGAVPIAHYLLKRFQHDNAYFGQAPFFFHARLSGFFKEYGKAIGLFMLGVTAASIFGASTRRLHDYLSGTSFGWLFSALYGLLGTYVLYLFVRPYLESRIQNMVWNNTEVGDNRFLSTVSARKLLWIHATNLALIMLTLGLYKPFATVRLVRYRVSCMALVPDGDLEEFLADQTADNAGALGQEAGDLFDVDIAL